VITPFFPDSASGVTGAEAGTYFLSAPQSGTRGRIFFQTSSSEADN